MMGRKRSGSVNKNVCCSDNNNKVVFPFDSLEEMTPGHKKSKQQTGQSKSKSSGERSIVDCRKCAETNSNSRHRKNAAVFVELEDSTNNIACRSESKTEGEENILKITLDAQNVLEMWIQPTNDNSLMNAVKTALRADEDSRALQEELIKFITEDDFWLDYCHHIYIQHQQSVQDLRDLDLTDRSFKVHRLAQNMYKQHLDTCSGSMLELIFASVKFQFSAVLVQFMQEQKEFHVFSINPHYPRKVTFLNIGPPHRGKWRCLKACSPQETLPPGIYSLESTLPERTFLAIRKKHHAGGTNASFEDGNIIPECNLELFNRLLATAARLDEFTFTLGYDHHPQNLPSVTTPTTTTKTLRTDGDLRNNHVSPSQEQLEFLLTPQKSPPPSDYAFKPLETLKDCEAWCRNLTKNREPKPLLLRKSEEECDFKAFQALRDLVNAQDLQDKLGQVNAPQEFNFSGDRGVDSNTNRGSGTTREQQMHLALGAGPRKGANAALEFQPLDLRGKVSMAMVQDDRFGSPQIILRFQPGARLIQEAEHTLFLRPIHAQISYSTRASVLSQFCPPKQLTEEFEIPQGSTFTLSNNSNNPVGVRCAWFTYNNNNDS